MGEVLIFGLERFEQMFPHKFSYEWFEKRTNREIFEEVVKLHNEQLVDNPVAPELMQNHTVDDVYEYGRRLGVYGEQVRVSKISSAHIKSLKLSVIKQTYQKFEKTLTFGTSKENAYKIMEKILMQEGNDLEKLNFMLDIHELIIEGQPTLKKLAPDLHRDPNNTAEIGKLINDIFKEPKSLEERIEKQMKDLNDEIPYRKGEGIPYIEQDYQDITMTEEEAMEEKQYEQKSMPDPNIKLHMLGITQEEFDNFVKD